MTKRLVLHIGRHKTGTTSIQRTLLNNREVLQSFGIHYPVTGMKGPGQHEFGNSVTRGSHWTLTLKDSVRKLRQRTTPYPPLPGSDKRRRPELRSMKHRDLLHYRDTLLAAPGDTVVISSEALQGADPRYIALLFAAFDVEPVCYLREQAAYLRSAYTQHVHATDYCQDIGHFYRYHFRVNYWRITQRWHRVFGEHCRFRVFEPDQLHGGNVVDDFLREALGLTPAQRAQVLPAPAENPSLSRQMLAFKLALNRGPFVLHHRLYQVLAQMSRGGDAYRLPPALGHRVVEVNRQPNARVAQTWFQREQLFFRDEPLAETPLAVTEDQFRAWATEANERHRGVIRFAPGALS